jgi:hypothetical protein
MSLFPEDVYSIYTLSESLVAVHDKCINPRVA